MVKSFYPLYILGKNFVFQGPGIEEPGPFGLDQLKDPGIGKINVAFHVNIPDTLPFALDDLELYLGLIGLGIDIRLIIDFSLGKPFFLIQLFDRFSLKIG